jgi:hypothetical protein
MDYRYINELTGDERLSEMRANLQRATTSLPRTKAIKSPNY